MDLKLSDSLNETKGERGEESVKKKEVKDWPECSVQV
jgi:hypothetical protein